ncbi:MAG: DUF116 domain-containing protein [Desulfobulbaceae bacterium]|nr:DUF116 domain-containing protein [Desulfobulbaceae bacterium]HIJ89643.1 DUF116 domain-containing protein [Deltaproteobacteria bacterium]
MTLSLPSWLSLPVLVFLYRPLAWFFPKMDKDVYVRRVVAVGNRFFRQRFVRTPYAERMLFLPYCLRAEGCATVIDQEKGLLCQADCRIPCRLREMREMALALGYRDVLVVVSGRVHKKDGVLRSRDFLVRQIGQHQPRAVLGCLCTRDLREKYLRSANVSLEGSLGRHGLKVIPQVCLLKDCNCRQSAVEWQELEALIRAKG